RARDGRVEDCDSYEVDVKGGGAGGRGPHHGMNLHAEVRRIHISGCPQSSVEQIAVATEGDERLRCAAHERLEAALLGSSSVDHTCLEEENGQLREIGAGGGCLSLNFYPKACDGCVAGDGETKPRRLDVAAIGDACGQALDSVGVI